MNKNLEVVLVIFAVIGFFVLYFRVFGWIYDAFQEAKTKDKRIEFTSMAIAMLAIILSIISLAVSLSK